MKRLLVLLALSGVVILLSCVDGENPTSVSAPQVANLALIPSVAPGIRSTAALAQPINRIRVTATKATDGTVLVVHVQDVDPSQDEWTLEVEIPVPEDGSQVVLTLELVHVEAGQETVEWSGQTPPVALTPGQSTQARAVEVVRGPTSNLGVTDVSVTPEAATVLEGDTVRLEAEVTTTSPESPVVYWASLDSAATVDADGIVTGVLPGVARVLAQSGGQADTAVITVEAVPAAVVVTPDTLVADSAGAEVAFEGAVVDARGDSVPGEAVVWRSRDTIRVASLGEGRFRVVGAGEAWIEARAASDTTLVDTALVVLEAPEADLSLEKSSEADEVSPGDTLTFRIEVRNQGPDSSGAFTVADTPPAGFALLDDSVTAGATDAQSLTWSVPGLAADSTVTWTLRFLATADLGEEPLIFNRASIAEQETFDPDPDDNEDVHELQVSSGADVGIAMSSDDTDPRVGDRVTVLIDLENLGPRTTSGVTVRPTFGEGFVFVRAEVDVGAVDPATGVWGVDTLQSGEEGRGFFELDVTDPGDPDFLWAVSASSRHRFSDSLGYDYNPANDTATLVFSVLPALADLTVEKTTATDTVVLGDTLDFRVAVINRGPGVARDVVVRDQADPGLGTLVVVDSSGFRGPPDSLVADSIAAGDTAWVALQALPDTAAAPGAHWNRATILGHAPSSEDPDPGDNADSVLVTVRLPSTDLEARKTVSADTANVGDTLTYRVVLRNAGPNPVDSARLVEEHDGWAVRGATLGSSTFQRISGVGGVGGDTLTAGPLSPGDSAVLIWSAIVDTAAAGGPVENRIYVDAMWGALDTAAGNDLDSVSTWVRPMADLSLVKSVNDPKPFEGDTVQFTLVVDNFGPGTAHGVQIQEAPDSGVARVVSVAVSSGTIDTTTAVWTLDSLAAGAADTLVLVAVVDSGTVADTLYNRAFNLRTAAELDPDTTNDAAQASVVVDQKQADLSLMKFALPSTPFEGDTVTFHVELQNFGSHTARNVQVYDSLDAGLTQVAHTSTRGVFDPPSRTWTVDSIAPGETDTLSLFVVVDSGTVGQTLTNRAAAFVLTHAVETNPANDSAQASVTVDQKVADVDVQKTVDNVTPFEGDVVKFTVTVDNYGSYPASNVQVMDTVDVGLSVDSVVASTGVWDTPSRTWTVPTLNVGSPESLQVYATVDSGTVGQTLTNHAAVIGLTGAVDTISTNDAAQASVVVDQKQADLSLMKFALPSTPFEGDTVTFHVELQNFGSHTARNVQVYDSLDAGLTQVAYTATRGVFDLPSRTWTVDSIAPGETDTLSLFVVVDSGTVGQNLTNRAAAFGLTHAVETNPANDSAQASVTVDQKVADLSLTKSSGVSAAAVGDSVQFTITVDNFGPMQATGVVVRDTLPTLFAFGSANPSQGVYDAATGVWTVGDLANGATATLEIVGSPASGSELTTLRNVAWVDPLAFEVDTTTADNADSADVFVDAADVAVGKSASKGSVIESDTLTYEVFARNDGSVPLTNVVVSDTLPTGVTYQGLRLISQGTYASGTGDWNVGTLNPGDSASIQIWVRVDPGTAGSTLDNVAFLKAMDQTDTNAANDTASAAATVSGADYLKVTKTASKPTIIESDTLTYEVSAVNVSSAPITNVVVSDTLPTGVTYQGLRLITQGTYASGTGDWNVGTLNPGDSAAIQLWVRVDPGTAGSTLDNVAFLKAMDQTDTNAANDTASATTTVSGADYLKVTKTASKPTIIESDTLTYEVSAVNVSSAPITNVVVSDTLPTGVTYQGLRLISQGTYASGTGDWNVGTLNPGDSAAIQLWVRVDPGTAGSTLDNVAFLKAMDQTDTNAANDTASATTTVSGADYVRVTKTASRSVVGHGDTLTYEVSAVNVSSAPVTNVVVSDTLPTGVTYQGLRLISQGTYASGTGDWNVGTLNPGDSAAIQIFVQADVTAGVSSPANLAFLKAMDQTDTNAANDTASATTTLDAPDLLVTKTTSNATPVEGQIFQYRVVVSNVGSTGITGVEVHDSIPAELEYLAASSSLTQGTYNAGTGRWVVGNIAAGDSAVAVFSVRPSPGSASTSLTNTAYVQATSEAQSHTGNDTASVGVTIGSTDFLQVRKATTNAAPAEGQPFGFHVVVRNLGPDSITGVSVADTLPPGLTRISHIATRGTYSPSTGVWTLGKLAAGQEDTLTLTARADTGTASLTLTNKAWGSVDQTDANPVNDTASVSVTPAGANYLQLTKTVSDTTPLPGDTVTYEVVVRNVGPAAAEGVQVFDTIPAGMSVVSGGIYTSEGTYLLAQHRWDSILLDTAEVDTLRVTVEVPADTLVLQYDNFAAARSGNTETVTSDDTATASLAVRVDTVNMALTKTVSNTQPIVGEVVTFTLSYSNYDSSPTRPGRVFIVDTLPAGLTYVGSTTAQGSYDPAGHLWDLGSPPDSTTITLSIDARVDTAAVGQTLTNQATIRPRVGWVDTNLVDNTASVTVTVQASDLIVTKQVRNGANAWVDTSYAPQVGDTVRFKVWLDDDTGWDFAPDSLVKVADLLPTGLTHVRDSLTRGTYDPVSGVWDVGFLPGTPDTLWIDATVAAGTQGTVLKNRAELISAAPWDGDATDNQDSVFIYPQLDLSLSKSRVRPVYSKSAPDSTVFRLVVRNHSGVTVTGVVVRDSMDAFFSVGGYSASQGTFAASGAVGDWSVGTLAPRDSATLQIQADYPALLTVGDSANNWAWIKAADQTLTNFANDTVQDPGIIATEAVNQQVLQPLPTREAEPSPTSSPSPTRASRLGTSAAPGSGPGPARPRPAVPLPGDPPGGAAVTADPPHPPWTRTPRRR